MIHCPSTVNLGRIVVPAPWLTLQLCRVFLALGKFLSGVLALAWAWPWYVDGAVRKLRLALAPQRERSTQHVYSEDRILGTIRHGRPRLQTVPGVRRHFSFRFWGSMGEGSVRPVRRQLGPHHVGGYWTRSSESPYLTSPLPGDKQTKCSRQLYVM